MVNQFVRLAKIQHVFSHCFFLFLRGITSVLLGFIASRCFLFENFSPFSLMLLSTSTDFKLIPTLCYLSSAVGYLSIQFDLSTIKYIIALTTIFFIYTIFHKATNRLHGDSIILSGLSCFTAGIICMLIDKITLFEVLLLISESTLISCCVYFITYTTKALHRSCFLTSKEIFAAIITLVLLLLLFHEVYIFQLNSARIIAIFIILLGIYCLKFSHAAFLGSCIGILLAGIGNGGDAIFTSTIVGALFACVISGFSQHLAPIAFVIVYDVVLLFFGKFPWHYSMFAEPLLAYTVSTFLPKEKIRTLLSKYIAVRSKEPIKQTRQKMIDACQKECSAFCPKSQICYDEHEEELKNALKSIADRYCTTEEFGKIEDSIPFCIKPHAMAHIIKNRLVLTHSEDFEDLIEQLDHISWKMKQRFDITNQEIRFLTDEEDDVKKTLSKRGIAVKEINFIQDEHGKRRCDLNYIPVNDDADEEIIKDVLSRHFQNRLNIIFEHDINNYYARAKEQSTYRISCAALCKSKNGEQICGDYAIGFSCGINHYYLMLSDGMGSGKVASVHSKSIVDTLHRLIENGLSIPNALNVYNASSRLQQDGYFTTIDICVVDLNKGSADFYKAGAFDSYFISKNEISTIGGGGLPLGLSEREKLNHKFQKLQSGDYIVMATDGIACLKEPIECNLAGCIDENVKIFARNIMEKIAQNQSGQINDDITVMVCKIQNSNE